MPGLALEYPAVMVTAHGMNIVLHQQRHAGIRTATAIHDVTRADDGIDGLFLEKVNRLFQTFMLGVNVSDHAKSTDHIIPG